MKSVNLRSFVLRLCATSFCLIPPYEQQVLHDLMFQSIFSRRIMQELERVLNPPGLKALE